MPTQKIEVLVSVDSEGRYVAFGEAVRKLDYDRVRDDVAAAATRLGPIRRQFWLTATVPLPTEEEIPAEVSDAQMD